MPTANAVAASIGISKVVVAVLLVISVRKVTARQIPSNSSSKGIATKAPSNSPNAVLMPVATKALARAIPPANSSNTPQ